MNNIYNILIAIFLVTFTFVHGDTKYYYNISSIDEIRQLSFIFLGIFILFTLNGSIKYIKKNKNIFIFFSLIFIWNFLYMFFIPENGQYFYSPVFLFIALGINHITLKKISNYMLGFSFLLSFIYILQLFSLVLLNGDYYVIERHFFDVLELGYTKYTSSLIFGNSNSAGSVLFLFLFLTDFLSKKKKILSVFIIITAIFFSGSLTGMIMAILWLFRDKIYRIGFKQIIYGIPIFFLIIYFIQINSGGYNTRIDRWLSFLMLFFSKPWIVLLPNNIFSPDFYSESTLIDMILNFGLIPILLFLRVIYEKKLFLIILYFTLTNSVFLPINAFIIGILIKLTNHELSYKAG